jgi:hypothetical protein
MFFNTPIPYCEKSVINPVSNPYYGGNCGGGEGGGGGGGGGGGTNITPLELESLRTIEELYTSNMADKHYANIPNNLTTYLKLFNIVSEAYVKYQSNVPLSLLFKITQEGLTGSINSYGLNTLNIELDIQNTWYQEQLQMIINGINVNKTFDQNVGTLSMTRTFELAPLFRYYIQYYGFPEHGVGFDPAKLNIVLTALENMGIDPYN